MFGMQDNFTPTKTWEEKVANAISICMQDKHLTKGKTSTSVGWGIPNSHNSPNPFPN
jgi:hypothetical protein